VDQLAAKFWELKTKYPKDQRLKLSLKRTPSGFWGFIARKIAKTHELTLEPARISEFVTYRGASSHDADPILIHQRVTGPYPAWSSISGHSSITRVSSVTDLHQSRFLSIWKISVIECRRLYGCRNTFRHTFPLAQRCIQRASHVSNQGNVWRRHDTPPECAAMDS
jgi:hypothetical protein